MRIKWITLFSISLIMIGCGPQAHIQKTYMQVDHKYTGEVTLLNSFDEVGKAYKKVADLKADDHRRPNNIDRNKMIESLKSKARKVNAEGLVIIDEGHLVDRVRTIGSWTNFYTFFIKGVAIVYE
jgi:hypothetical protein